MTLDKPSPRPDPPEGWEQVALSVVVPRAEYGISTSLGSEGAIPVLRMNNLANGEAELSDLKYSDSSGASSLLLKPEDVLFNRTNSMEHVGRTGIWRGQIARASFASYLVRLVPDRQRLLPGYLNKWLNFPPTQTKVRRWATPAVQQVNINPSNLRKTIIDLPPLEEQVRITDGLDLLDETIRATGDVIDKLTTIKRTLTYQLLTCGVNEAGEHRDVRVHSSLFKKTPFGDIPLSWDILSASSICDEIVVGIVVRPSQYYKESGVSVLRSANVRENGLDPSSLVFMSNEDNIKLAKSQVRTGNVLTVRTGYPGTSCVVTEEFDCANCVDIIISRPGFKVLPEYYSLWLNSEFGKGQVLRSQGGLAQQHFNVGQLQQLRVYLPPIEEQRRIVSIFNSAESLILGERRWLDNLLKLKSGLASDLLSGRVRTRLH